MDRVRYLYSEHPSSSVHCLINDLVLVEELVGIFTANDSLNALIEVIRDEVDS